VVQQKELTTVQYISKAPGLTMIIRDQTIDPRLSMPGRPYVTKDVLTVEFGRYGGALRPQTPTGQTDEFGNPKTIPMHHEFGNQVIYADFRGGLIDLEEMIEDKKIQGLWDEEDAELIRRTLEDACDNPRSLFFGEIQRHQLAPPTAPWPTYDSMDTDLIPAYAQEGGLIGEALFYEASVHKRPEVLEALQSKAEQSVALTASAVEE